MIKDTNKDGQPKWYMKIAKRIGKGIMQFLLPVIVLVFVFEKAISLAQSIILPIKSHLPEGEILGIGMFPLISVLLILILCYMAGMLSDRKWVKAFFSFIEDNLLIFIPGYAMLKSSADSTINEDNNWKVVLIDEGEDLMYGIEVDRQADGYSMIFFPDPPDAKSGDMKLIQQSKFKRVNFPVNKFIKIIRNYGHGSAEIPK